MYLVYELYKMAVPFHKLRPDRKACFGAYIRKYSVREVKGREGLRRVYRKLDLHITDLSMITSIPYGPPRTTMRDP